jgi:hypothetical protein
VTRRSNAFNDAAAAGTACPPADDATTPPADAASTLPLAPLALCCLAFRLFNALAVRLRRALAPATPPLTRCTRSRNGTGAQLFQR